MRCFLLFVVAALVTGCDSRPSAAPANPPPLQSPSADGSSLQARLDAAMQIAGLESRDDALARVALDAANAKQPAVVKKAIQNIAGVEGKDRTAEQCAVALAKRSEPRAANEVAQLISSVEARDRTFGTIAKGQ